MNFVLFNVGIPRSLILGTWDASWLCSVRRATGSSGAQQCI